MEKFTSLVTVGILLSSSSISVKFCSIPASVWRKDNFFLKIEFKQNISKNSFFFAEILHFNLMEV